MTHFIQGFVPAVVTPFTPHGEIMEDAFAEIVDRQIANDASGICVAGDNGESWSLSVTERARLTGIAVERAKGRPVVTGISAPTARQSLDYARAAKEAGASALLSMPPTYVLKASRDELHRRFELLAEVNLPIILYNSPRRAGVDLSIHDVEGLLAVAPITGIKESSRDLFHHTHLLRRLGDRIAVMTGPSHFILPCAALGAAGYIATGPELLGPAGATLGALGRKAPDEDYVEIHYRLTVLYQLLMGTGTWPSALKAALTLIGLPAGVPRDPVLPLPEAAIATMRSTLDELGLLP